jgi:hypothetical protein
MYSTNNTCVASYVKRLSQVQLVSFNTINELIRCTSRIRALCFRKKRKSHFAELTDEEVLRMQAVIQGAGKGRVHNPSEMYD